MRLVKPAGRPLVLTFGRAQSATSTLVKPRESPLRKGALSADYARTNEEASDDEGTAAEAERLKLAGDRLKAATDLEDVEITFTAANDATVAAAQAAAERAQEMAYSRSRVHDVTDEGIKNHGGESYNNTMAVPGDTDASRRTPEEYKEELRLRAVAAASVLQDKGKEWEGWWQNVSASVAEAAEDVRGKGFAGLAAEATDKVKHWADESKSLIEGRKQGASGEGFTLSNSSHSGPTSSSYNENELEEVKAQARRQWLSLKRAHLERFLAARADSAAHAPQLHSADLGAGCVSTSDGDSSEASTSTRTTVTYEAWLCALHPSERSRWCGPDGQPDSRLVDRSFYASGSAHLGLWQQTVKDQARRAHYAQQKHGAAVARAVALAAGTGDATSETRAHRPDGASSAARVAALATAASAAKVSSRYSMVPVTLPSPAGGAMTSPALNPAAASGHDVGLSSSQHTEYSGGSFDDDDGVASELARQVAEALGSAFNDADSDDESESASFM